MNFKTKLMFVFISCAAVSAVADNESGTFTGSDASVVITQALIKAGAGEDVSVHINDIRDEDPITTASSSVSADVDGLNYDKEHSSWKATLLFKAGGRNLAPANISGTYDEMISLPMLKHQVHMGEMITQDDIEMDKEPAKQVRQETVTAAQELIGKSPKHVISEKRPIRQDEIATQTVLQKGTHVTMMYKSHNLEIRTTGEALDAGAKGDVVRVRNLTSKSIVSGVVEASDRIRVTSPDVDSAEAM